MSGISQPSALPALPAGLRLAGEGVVLREWTSGDLTAMVELFDDPEVAHWTALSSPFDRDAAREHLAKVRASRSEGLGIQLAVTKDGEEPHGEIVLFRSPEDEEGRDIELGYSIGARSRRQGLATAALRVMTDYARREFAPERLVLRIEEENTPSNAVARAVGYRLTDDEPVIREIRGRTMALRTWSRPGRPF
ncbi:hypothetical protein GCM10009716_11100 [Streptomyces sodiiphilus]|uniref:N-acetyltransferase domain-containing protein n=1 Tax=Streptomyces sodiiphilus TaxID=226217 RepID=A0ABN2NYD1_9ACTN